MKKGMGLFFLLAIAGYCLLLAPAARADVPATSVYLGAYGGGHLVLSDWDLNENAGTFGPESSAVFGLRVGVQMFFWLGIEADLGLLPAQSTEGGDNLILMYSGDLLFHLWRGNWVPFVDFGLGGYYSADGDLGRDPDFQLHGGLGLRGMLTDWMALRLDARYVNTDGTKWEDVSRGNNLEFTVGLDFYLWSESREPEEPAEPADQDGDGIPDDQDECPAEKGGDATRGCPDRDGDGLVDGRDACPDQAGQEALKGCPDKDDDGVADGEDRCPADAGPVSLKGCPDRDGDGIADMDDKCPDQKGTAERKGCPEPAAPSDQDGDGVLDADDACPNQAGKADLKGCPDQDGDGIADGDDECPADAGPADLKGCPDRDGDGIADRDDKCPDTKGIVEQQGCLPPEIEKKFSGSIKGITFRSGSARLRKESEKVLDETVQILKDFEKLTLVIEGHTDSIGPEQANQRLSQARADAVRDYLLKKGIEADRVEAKGYGESKPIADNKTREGRAENRRIEFRILTR